MAKRMTTAEKRERAEELSKEAEEIYTRSGGLPMGDEADAFDSAIEERDKLMHEVEDEERRHAEMVRNVKAGNMYREAGSEQHGYSGAENNTRTRGLAHLERQHKDGLLTDVQAHKLDTLVRSSTVAEQWQAVAGDPDYASAFGKLLANPERGHLEWTDAEARAYQRAAEVQRAMAIGSDGHAMVPSHLDPSIILTGSGSVSSIRAISRVETITSDVWHGVTSTGVVSEWLAEAAEAADATPTLGAPSIAVHKSATWVPFSYEWEQDAANGVAELQRVISDAVVQQENAAFATGSGVGQPKGVVTALVAAGGGIVPGAGEAITAADVYATQNALGARFQTNAQWAANLSILNALRQLETSNGALTFPSLQANPVTLLGRAVSENSNLDGVINAAATESNYVLIYGDWSHNVIVDRVGTTVELVPQVFGANRRPTGQRGIFVHRRVGSDVVVPNAFRVLRINTTA